ncbi:MAG: 60s acidic ribosomal protein-domain-containing protein [Olpidium bornovanus]|uniref:60s acidic ribosomal protein-domain-containing protein n=1 Tax=Olpidium bornovanus TaxID=278681 RepID=A0A8H7ZSJ3_9FUNG|nr:MAG: 60s acidic ribosomal protein-domain-containing protein [Olpidium bornovanus]
MSNDAAEQACVYAALILHDDGVDITLPWSHAALRFLALFFRNRANAHPAQSDKLAVLVKAAGVDVESVWTNIFAKALSGKNVGDLLMNVGSGSAAAAAGGAAAGGAAAGGAAAEAKAEEKVEEKEESDEDMGFGG